MVQLQTGCSATVETVQCIQFQTGCSAKVETVQCIKFISVGQDSTKSLYSDVPQFTVDLEFINFGLFLTYGIYTGSKVDPTLLTGTEICIKEQFAE